MSTDKPIPTEYRSTHVTSVEPNTKGPTQDGVPKQFWARVMSYGELDDYGTKFRPGCFTKSLQRRLPRLMYGHAGWENPNALLGRAIDFRDSSDGLDLLFEFDDFNFVPAAKQIAHQMTNDPSNPTLDQFSVGFKRIKDERASQANGGGVWITEARLGETSVVVEGAVPGTKTLQFRDANGTVLDGQTIDANDAARLLAELSTGKIDLGDALSQVKQLAAYDPEPEPEDPEDEPDDGDEIDEDIAAMNDDELDAALREAGVSDDDEDEEAKAKAEADAAAKQAEEEAALAELDSSLVAVGSRHPFVEARGEHAGHKFHGNQHGHGGSGASSSGGGGTAHASQDDAIKESARLHGGNVYHMKASSPKLAHMSHDEIDSHMQRLGVGPYAGTAKLKGDTSGKLIKVAQKGAGKAMPRGAKQHMLAGIRKGLTGDKLQAYVDKQMAKAKK